MSKTALVWSSTQVAAPPAGADDVVEDGVEVVEDDVEDVEVEVEVEVVDEVVDEDEGTVVVGPRCVVEVVDDGVEVELDDAAVVEEPPDASVVEVTDPDLAIVVVVRRGCAVVVARRAVVTVVEVAAAAEVDNRVVVDELVELVTVAVEAERARSWSGAEANPARPRPVVEVSGIAVVSKRSLSGVTATIATKVRAKPTAAARPGRAQRA